jgi:hypothetical protein
MSIHFSILVFDSAFTRKYLTIDSSWLEATSLSLDETSSGTIFDAGTLETWGGLFSILPRAFYKKDGLASPFKK